MTEQKRFTITQNGDLFTVRDTVENKAMGVFEFKQNEFPVYFCFHKIIDKMNALNDENEQLKKQMQRLYNYFVDWHGDIMGANQFSEMWDAVKEDEDWDD